MKFLLDKLANPHICFGPEHLDACDLAKRIGMDRRFFVFSKCSGEHKVVPQDAKGVVMIDLHEKDIKTEYNYILEQNTREEEEAEQ